MNLTSKIIAVSIGIFVFGCIVVGLFRGSNMGIAGAATTVEPDVTLKGTISELQSERGRLNDMVEQAKRMVENYVMKRCEADKVVAQMQLQGLQSILTDEDIRKTSDGIKYLTQVNRDCGRIQVQYSLVFR